MNEPKNYRAIMLSSTFTDLKDHRARAIEVIQKLGYMPRVMEHSGAQAEADVIDTSLQMVQDAVAYVGVISLKYGQTPADPVRNPDKLSVTELEFNEAMLLKRPIVLFIMGEEHSGKKGDFESDPDKLKKLNEFRERAKKMREGGEVERIYETFDSLEQFSTAAATALGNLVRYIERLAPAEAPNAAERPVRTISNIPINIPFHFVGRDIDLAEIDNVLNREGGRAAIVVLHGLRGVGKTTLAATYAVRHRDKYRATWWIKAETEATMRADLVGLGVQLGWIAPDAQEEKSFGVVLDRLSTEGDGILLIYDNAIGPKDSSKFLPRGFEPRIIVTSNAPNWGGVATPVEIEVWSKETGADFLMARTGRATERDAALELSDALGGLPLAHEQAAAYCERIGVSLADYAKRLETIPGVLDSIPDAAGEYHGGLTVAKTFALAIDEAAKRHPAADALITYAALLASEPIPLFLFTESREKFASAFASQIQDDGLDEALAALRAFALVDRETIPDERDPSIVIDCIRLHRLVRAVAVAQKDARTKNGFRRDLIAAMADVYPNSILRDPATWPRVRRLDAVAVALVGNDDAVPEGAEDSALTILERSAAYRQRVLAAPYLARPLLERSLAISENAFGPGDSRTATCLNNLAYLLQAQGDVSGARALLERAIAIREEVQGPEHPEIATCLNNLGFLLKDQGEFSDARSYYERALAIREKTLGPDHPDTATILNNLGILMRKQGQLREAQSYYERALAINERVLGPEHPSTAMSLNNVGTLLVVQGKPLEARRYYERACGIHERVLGPSHPDTKLIAKNTAMLFDRMGLAAEAAALRQKFGLKDDE